MFQSNAEVMNHPAKDVGGSSVGGSNQHWIFINYHPLYLAAQ
jgi:hypothetical protein